MKNKGFSLVIAIIIVIVLIAIVSVGAILINKKGNNSNTIGSTIANKEDATDKKDEISNNTEYSKYTDSFPKEQRDLDYYWNINTEGYSSSKFNGEISFFGEIIKTKITGKTLKENGYTIVDPDSSYSYGKNFFSNKIVDYTLKSGLVQKNSQQFPNDSDLSYTLKFPEFINFSNNDDFYTDETEFYYQYSKTVKKDSNIVFPSLNGTKYADLNIDLIIEQMGVPTFVGRGDILIPTTRTSPDTKDIITFNYYYEYPEYTFVFQFMGFNHKFAGVCYMGKNIFNHTFFDNEMTLKEKLQNAQKEYLCFLGTPTKNSLD